MIDAPDLVGPRFSSSFWGADQENMFIHSVNDAPTIELQWVFNAVFELDPIHRPMTKGLLELKELHYSSLELYFRRNLLESISSLEP